MSQTILVTGGAGFIGSHLVDALIAAGHRVRVFDNLEPQVHGSLREQGRWPDYCNPGAEYFLGDVRDRDSLSQAMQDADVVFHQAAMVGVGQSMYEIERYVDVNTRGTAVLLDVLANDNAVRERLRKLVVASSMSIYGEGKYECPLHGVVYPRLRPLEQLSQRDWEMHCPIGETGTDGSGPSVCNQVLKPLSTGEDKPLHPTSIYAISKKDQEEMCLSVGRAYEIPTVALRYFNVYGARQALSNPYTGVAAIFSSRLLNGKPPVIYEDGMQRRDFVHVSDIVQANVLALENPDMDDGVFNVGTGQALTILDVAKALISHSRKDCRPAVVQKFRVGDIRHCFPDISRLQSMGYQPRIYFEEGIAELMQWVQMQESIDRFDKAFQDMSDKGLTL
jgi:dTDP-L-rhamnose 4-epimerase